MRRLVKRSIRFPNRQIGFTLLEVLVGVFIIAGVGLGVIRAIDTNAKARQILDEKVQAANLVTAYLEGIRQLPYSDSTNPYASVNTSVVTPPQYVVTTNITYSPDGVYWATNNNSGAYKLQRIAISISRQGGKPVFSTCTFKSPRIK